MFYFYGDLYGHEMEVQFVKYLREEIKFPSFDLLRIQIQKDAENARRIFEI